ncbi:MAG: ABC transporter ATP-binding protein [Muribaculaceae bacterium]|nr:ABC transporter ATP-binding protein [Muribaculaceae bacterium]
MLKIENLSYHYGLRKPPVLRDFSLEIEQGGIYGLLGPNGAGKSTLLYLIMGALLPDKGVVYYNGQNTRRRSPSVLSDIMLVPEEVGLPNMKLDAYVSARSGFYPRFDRDILNRCLDAFGMEYNVRLNALSMGQKKKVYMSFALACNTSMVLMDEPTNGLDIPGKAAFRRLCAELMTDDRIMIISTHQVRDLEQLLDHVLIMNERNIIFESSIYELQRRLSFVRNVDAAVRDQALYWQPAPGGYDVMLPNTDNDETTVNLELLFDYALKYHDRLNQIFDKPTEISL